MDAPGGLMRICFGTTVLEAGKRSGGIDGIGRYTEELGTALMGRGRVRILPFEYGAGMTDSLTEDRICAGRFGTQALWSAASGDGFFRMQDAIAGRVDLVHAPDHFVPRLKGVPVVATIMDAIPLAHPEWVSYRFKRLKNALWAKSVNWANHIVTISEYSKTQIAQWFRFPEDRIRVVPLGVDDAWFDSLADVEVERVVERYGLPPRYFVFVGTLQPRKNLARVIRAHQSLAASMRTEMPLVVVGRAGWECDQEVGLLNKRDEALRWLQYVPQVDLYGIVKCASALVYPSLSEGFGLPLLEAFAAGVPVVSSNTTSIPEVAGDAALLVNPESVVDIAEAMASMATDFAMVNRLIAAGRERATGFTWDKTAECTELVYAEALQAFHG